METKSVWLDGVREPRACLEGGHVADVAVIGGGIGGVAAAYFAAQAGLGTVLLEEGALGGGASGHGAGFVVAGGGVPYAALVKQAGAEGARHVYEATLKNQMLLEALLGADAAGVGYEAAGSFCFAFTAEEESLLRRSQRALHRAGFSAEEADPSALPWRLKEAGARFGLFIPGDGALDPVALVAAVGALAEQWGARVHEGSRVLKVRRENGDYILDLPSGTVTARALVVASGTWMNGLLPQTSFVTAQSGQMLLTGPVPAGEARPVLGERGRRFFRRLPQGGLLIGQFDGPVGPSGSPANAPQGPAIETFAKNVVGHTVQPARRWSATAALTPDGLPLAGRAADGLYLVGGLGGYGLSFALFAAELVGAALAGEERSFAPFAPARFLPPQVS